MFSLGWHLLRRLGERDRNISVSNKIEIYRSEFASLFMLLRLHDVISMLAQANEDFKSQ